MRQIASAPPVKLYEMVFELVHDAAGPLPVAEIERKTWEMFGDEEFNTFQVRAAVWQLVREGRAEFTPDREVRALSTRDSVSG
jgi:hypothetical protein